MIDVCRDLHLRPDRTVVYICGNPDMILNAESALMDHGFPEFHVKKELYWPKGKTATGGCPLGALRGPEPARTEPITGATSRRR